MWCWVCGGPLSQQEPRGLFKDREAHLHSKQLSSWVKQGSCWGMALSAHFRVIPALSGAVIMCSLNSFAFEEIWKQGSVLDPQSSEIPVAPASFLQCLSVAWSPLKLPLHTPTL